MADYVSSAFALGQQAFEPLAKARKDRDDYISRMAATEAAMLRDLQRGIIQEKLASERLASHAKLQEQLASERLANYAKLQEQLRSQALKEQEWRALELEGAKFGVYRKPDESLEQFGARISAAKKDAYKGLVNKVAELTNAYTQTRDRLFGLDANDEKRLASLAYSYIQQNSALRKAAKAAKNITPNTDLANIQRFLASVPKSASEGAAEVMNAINAEASSILEQKGKDPSRQQKLFEYEKPLQFALQAQLAFEKNYPEVTSSLRAEDFPVNLTPPEELARSFSLNVPQPTPAGNVPQETDASVPAAEEQEEGSLSGGIKATVANKVRQAQRNLADYMYNPTGTYGTEMGYGIPLPEREGQPGEDYKARLREIQKEVEQGREPNPSYLELLSPVVTDIGRGLAHGLASIPNTLQYAIPSANSPTYLYNSIIPIAQKLADWEVIPEEWVPSQVPDYLLPSPIRPVNYNALLEAAGVKKPETSIGKIAEYVGPPYAVSKATKLLSGLSKVAPGTVTAPVAGTAAKTGATVTETLLSAGRPTMPSSKFPSYTQVPVRPVREPVGLLGEGNVYVTPEGPGLVPMVVEKAPGGRPYATWPRYISPTKELRLLPETTATPPVERPFLGPEGQGQYLVLPQRVTTTALYHLEPYELESLLGRWELGSQSSASIPQVSYDIARAAETAGLTPAAESSGLVPMVVSKAPEISLPSGIPAQWPRYVSPFKDVKLIPEFVAGPPPAPLAPPYLGPFGPGQFKTLP